MKFTTRTAVPQTPSLSAYKVSGRSKSCRTRPSGLDYKPPLWIPFEPTHKKRLGVRVAVPRRRFEWHRFNWASTWYRLANVNRICKRFPTVGGGGSEPIWSPEAWPLCKRQGTFGSLTIRSRKPIESLDEAGSSEEWMTIEMFEHLQITTDMRDSNHG